MALISASSCACLSSISFNFALASLLHFLVCSSCFCRRIPAWHISSTRESIRAAPLSASRSSHSHIVMTCQPSASRWAVVTSSRWRFLSIFVSKNYTFDFGLVAYLHPLWPCQKHPLTIIATLYLGKRISGLPGNFLLCNRKRNPRAYSPFLTRISGLVFLARIRDIQYFRWVDESLSDMHYKLT